MYHVNRSDYTIESALVETLRVPATQHRYAASVKDSGAVRGIYTSAEAARSAAPGAVGPKGTYRVTAVHPVECRCSPMSRVMDGED